MNVLIVTGIFPPDLGGPATSVPRVARDLVRRGHAVTVLTLSDSMAHMDQQFPYQVCRIPRDLPRLLRWVYTVATIWRLGHRANAVFVNGLAMEAALANIARRKPLVLKVVGDLAWERSVNSGRTRSTLEQFQHRRHDPVVETTKKLRSWWTCRADRVVVPSRYLARMVAGWGVPPWKLSVVYNALERPAEAVQTLAAPLATPLKLITVSRLVPWKHVDRIIEVLRHPELGSMGLIVIGDGPERARLEHQADLLGLAARVHFAGSREAREVFGLAASADIFVLNSSYEGFPHVLLEAMSLGLPVVATAVGGTPELVEDGVSGRLIPPFDDNALLRVLAELSGDPSQRVRLGQAAEVTASRFSAAHAADALESLLASTARSR